MNIITKIFFPYDYKPEHFKALDGLRGLAVLLVALAHCSNPNTDIHLASWLNFKSMGQSGVFLFFILSSYLLDRQIAIAMMSKNDGIRYWLNYFLRRFLRIFPLFFFSLLLNASLRSINFRYTLPIEFSDIIPHLLLLEAKGIYWSIPVEFKYYFISPLLMLVIKLLTNWRMKYVMICSIFFISVFTYLTMQYEFDKISVFKFIPVFLVGSFVSIFELIKRESLKHFALKYYKWIDLFGMICFILILLLTGVYYYDLVFDNRGLFKIFRNQYIWQSLLYSIILLAAKFGNGFVEKALCFKPLRYIGVVSFSFYLFHMPILRFFKTLKGSMPDPILILLFILATCAFSSITFLLIERPLSKIKLFKKPLNEKILN